MTSPEYKAIRESIGSTAKVAELLGVTRQTIHARETGKPITQEAEMAILALVPAAKTKKR